MEEKEIMMDQDVKKELQAIEKRLELILHDSIRGAIREGVTDLKETITALFNKDINHITDHLNRHEESLKSNNEEFKRIWKAVNGIRPALIETVDNKLVHILDDIEELKAKNLKLSVSHDTADKIEEKIDRKKSITNGQIGAIIALSTLIGSIIGYIIKVIT